MIPTRAKVKNCILRQPEFSSGGGGEPGGTREGFFLCALPPGTNGLGAVTSFPSNWLAISYQLIP